jgi:hypothetical protein
VSSYDVTVTDVMGCQGTDSRVVPFCDVFCTEPSATDVSPAVPPLTVNAAGTQVTVEKIPCAEGYVVYENDLATWYGTPGRGCTTAWTDNLDGTVTFDYAPVNGDAWLVVGAWSAAGESSVGRDSAGAERNAQPGWPPTGPCP